MHYDQGSSILGPQKWFNIRNSINVIHYVNRLKEEKSIEYLRDIKKLFIKMVEITVSLQIGKLIDLVMDKKGREWVFEYYVRGLRYFTPCFFIT